MSRKVILQISSFTIILILGILTMSLLGSTEKHSNKNEIPKNIRTVEVKKIQFGDHRLKIEGNGVIESQRILDIVSEATGQIIYAKNNLKSGTYVTRGEKILEIDSREVKNNLVSMRSDFLNSVAVLLPELKIEDLEIYQKWMDYFISLNIEEETPVLPEIKNTQEQIKASTRNIFAKYYNVKNQEILLSKHTISAPFDGYIKSMGLIENSFVSRNQPLFTLTDLDNLEITVPLLVSEYSKVDFAKNPVVIIHADNNPDDQIKGIIDRTDAKLDRNSQTIEVYVKFSNNNQNASFLPGNYVKVEIEGKNLRNVAVIPRHSIDNESRIFVKEGGKLSSKKVRVAAIQNNYAIIESTISDKTELVTTILQKPIIGMAIKTAEEVELQEQTIDTVKEINE